LAAKLVKEEAKTVAKTLKDVDVEPLFDMLPDTLSEVVAKTIVDALTLKGTEMVGK